MTKATQLPLEGRQLGRYRILSRIGRGGMAEVYLAEDTDLRRRIALKVLPPERALDPTRVARLRQEAQALAALSHPNIVTIHSIESSDGLHFLTMELVEGEPLSELIRESGLPLGQVFDVAVPLADALAVAHAAGFVHRDLKPRNLMVTTEGELKVLDFGLAKLLERPEGDGETTLLDEVATRDGVAMGTVLYMSPEQLRGEMVDARSDIFSVGLILYELATGKRPYEGFSPSDRLLAMREGEPPSTDELRPDLPHHLGRIVRRCLEHDPERRYQVAKDLRNDLEDLRVETSEGLAARPARVPERRRRRRLAALGAMAALALALLVVWVATRPGPEPEPAMTLSALVTEPMVAADSRISPDGQWISFTTERPLDNELWLRRVGGGERIVVATVDGFLDSHAWSPDGEEIALVVRRSDEILLQTVPAFGGPPSRTFPLSAFWGSLRLVRWLDAGLFAADGSGLHRVDLEEGVLQEVLPARFDGGRRFHFDVRPDGRGVAYCLREEHGSSLWVANLDGSGARRLTGTEFSANRPRWIGPRGDQLVYSTNRSGQADLWWISARDLGGRQVTFSGAAEIVQDAAGDGSLLTFGQYEELADLWALRVDSGEMTRLTAAGLNDVGPSTAAGRLAFQRSKPQLEQGLGFLEGQIFLGRLSDLGLADARLVVEDGASPLLGPGEWLAFLRRAGRDYAVWLRDLGRGRELRVTERYKIPGVYYEGHDFVRANTAWGTDGRTLYAVAVAPGGHEEILRFDPAASRPEPRPLVSDPEWSYGDLQPSPDGRLLAFHRRTMGEPDRQEIRALDLASGEARTLLGRDGEEWEALYLAGWLERGPSLVVLPAVADLDWTERLEVLTVELSGAQQQLGTIHRAFGGNAVLDAAAGALYLVASGDGEDARNLFAYSLGERRLRRLTDNREGNVTFTGLHVPAPGALVFTRHESRESTWMVRFEADDG